MAHQEFRRSIKYTTGSTFRTFLRIVAVGFVVAAILKRKPGLLLAAAPYARAWIGRKKRPIYGPAAEDVRTLVQERPSEALQGFEIGA